MRVREVARSSLPSLLKAWGEANVSLGRCLGSAFGFLFVAIGLDDLSDGAVRRAVFECAIAGLRENGRAMGF
jgi:hypothetical protein